MNIVNTAEKGSKMLCSDISFAFNLSYYLSVFVFIHITAKYKDIDTYTLISPKNTVCFQFEIIGLGHIEN